MAKISGDELLRYVVERALASWADARSGQPRAEVREPWMHKWFGMVPMGVQLWWRSRKREKPHAPGS